MAKVLVLAYALLALAWVFSDPPGAGPDEPANYVKAIAIGGGQLLGQPGPLPAQVATRLRLDGPRYAFANSTTRWVTVPPNLAPVGFACNAFDATQPAACIGQTQPSAASNALPTYTGTYEPFVYAIPGLLGRLGDNAATALLVMRATNAVLCLALLALAVSLLSDKAAGALPMLGLMLAATPELIWLTAIVNASGPEVCAGLCFFAGVLRMSRPQAVSRGVWIALMTSGTALALSRPLGVIWLALDLMLLIQIVRPAGLRRRFQDGGWYSRAAAVVVLCSTGLAVAWEAAIEPHHGTALAEVLQQLPTAVWGLPQDVREGVGVFGWLETYMPSAGYDVWALVVAVILGFALVIGTHRQRMMLGLLAALTVAVTLGVAAAIIGPVGFALQGRYVMPFTLTLPLFAGEVIYRHRERIPRIATGYLVAVVGLTTAGLQLVGWLSNARREAVGVGGPLAFWARSQWSPPLGWLPWFVLVAIGCVALVAASRLSSVAAAAPAKDAGSPLAA